MNKEEMLHISWKETVQYTLRAFAYRFGMCGLKYKVLNIITRLFFAGNSAIALVTAAMISNVALLASGQKDKLRLVVVLFLIQAIYSYLPDLLRNYQDYVGIRDNIMTDTKVKEDFLNKIFRIPYKCFDNSGDFKTMSRDIVSSAEYITREAIWILDLPSGIISLSISFTILFALSPSVALLAVLVCIPDYYVNKNQQSWSFYDKINKTEEYELQNIFANFTVRREYIKEVRFYNIFNYIRYTWEKLMIRLNRRVMKAMSKFMLAHIGTGLIKNLAMGAILLLAAARFIHDPAIGIGTFYLMYTASKNLQGQASSLTMTLAGIRTSSLNYKAFFAILDWRQEPVDENAKPFENMDISVEHMSFAYPNREENVLKDISVKIRQGEKVAIIGENGSGKTTFVSLLCGLYGPGAGSITVNGINLREALGEARKSTSAILQEFGRYDMTIRENIVCGDPDREVPDEELERVCALTGADEVYKTKSGGVDTMIGTFSEKQENLSGGEWQKVALARALIKKDARMLILDEPTASLDPIAESELYGRFAEVSGDRTVLLISHRLGAAALVDRILVFKDGHIVEDGSHTELMNKNGEYAAMYRAQAQWYSGDKETQAVSHS